MNNGEMLAFMAEVFAPERERIVRLEEALRDAVRALGAHGLYAAADRLKAAMGEAQ